MQRLSLNNYLKTVTLSKAKGLGMEKVRFFATLRSAQNDKRGFEIVTKRAFGLKDGIEAKKYYYGFVKNTFRELQSGAKQWSEITREDGQFVEAEKKCAYCGSSENIVKEHIVPKSLRIKPECENCDTIQGIHMAGMTLMRYEFLENTPVR